jgi:hypothetical protein
LARSWDFSVKTAEELQVQGAGSREQGAGCRVQGAGSREQGAGEQGENFTHLLTQSLSTSKLSTSALFT